MSKLALVSGTVLLGRVMLSEILWRAGWEAISASGDRCSTSDIVAFQ